MLECIRPPNLKGVSQWSFVEEVAFRHIKAGAIDHTQQPIAARSLARRTRTDGADPYG